MEATDLSRALRLVESGLVRLTPLVSARYGLDEWHEAFGDLVRQSGLKIVIEP
jgi:threonine dehydrogenase-like Zn-dependent dehydrogenase